MILRHGYIPGRDMAGHTVVHGVITNRYRLL